MSLLYLPNVPADERSSFKQRVIRKHEAYLSKMAAGQTNALQEQGERYEIAVAIYLYRNHLLNKGEYLSRWLLPGETVTQSVLMGLNNEYDFLLSDSQGVMLGDAKSESSGLGGYLKKAISYCLLDYHVRGRESRLAGFCFATPSNPAAMFWNGLRNAFEILTTLSDCAGITGMNSQLIPTDIKIYFRSRYLVNNQIIRMDALNRDPEYYMTELREKAGFGFQFLQVAQVGHDELERQIQMLASKQRWTTA